MGRYKALDRLSKIIVISLSITTIAAVAIAVNKGMQMQEGFIEPSPWNLAALGFIIALMGWMPAPIEIAAINSLWVTARQRHEPVSYRDGMFDFDVGYITSAVLAIVFLALGVYVQYGNGETLEIQKGGLSIIFIRFFLKENFQRTHTDWQRSHETRHHDRVEQVGPQTSYFSTYFYDVSY